MHILFLCVWFCFSVAIINLVQFRFELDVVPTHTKREKGRERGIGKRRVKSISRRRFQFKCHFELQRSKCLSNQRKKAGISKRSGTIQWCPVWTLYTLRFRSKKQHSSYLQCAALDNFLSIFTKYFHSSKLALSLYLNADVFDPIKQLRFNCQLCDNSDTVLSVARLWKSILGSWLLVAFVWIHRVQAVAQHSTVKENDVMRRVLRTKRAIWTTTVKCYKFKLNSISAGFASIKSTFEIQQNVLEPKKVFEFIHRAVFARHSRVKMKHIRSAIEFVSFE